MEKLQIGHFGLRTKDVDRAIEWYGRAFGAEVRFRNEFAAFMSFDDEHHRMVIWDDGETEDKPAAAAGVDHIGFMCSDPHQLAEHYERLKGVGIVPTMSVNHHFTSSIYYRDPDGNEVEISCDNLPSKQAASDFMRSEAMAEAMTPPVLRRRVRSRRVAGDAPGQCSGRRACADRRLGRATGRGAAIVRSGFRQSPRSSSARAKTLSNIAASSRPVFWL